MLFADNEILKSTREAVNSAVNSGRLPCSILISGGSASLREKCAFELAASVLCTENKNSSPCMKCSACLRAMSGVHPDIIKMLPEDGKKLLSIKAVRDNCLSRLYTAPAEGDNKIFIFPSCDDMSVVIQNALLKSVEEPPEDTLFILCADARESLLTTVISRLTEYPLGDPLSSKSKKSDEDITSCAENIAMAMANEDEFVLMTATGVMHKNRKMMASVAEKLILIIRDAMTEGSSAEKLSGCEMASYALSRSFRISSLLQIKEIMDKIISEAASNANENLLISRFSSEIAVVMKDRI